MPKDHDSPRRRRVVVTIEVPRGSYIKRDAHGHIDLISPIPAPFNYGRIDGEYGGDGEPQDAVVLGPRRSAHEQLTLPVWGVVLFRDGGVDDHKWVCSTHPPSRRQLALIRVFFSLYATLKCGRDLLQGNAPRSHFSGWKATSLS